MLTAQDTDMLAFVASRFAALSDISRLRLLLLLKDQPRNVNALTEALGTLSQGAVSKHLAILKAANLIRCDRDGNSMIYAVADESVFEMCSLVCGSIIDHVRAQQAMIPATADRRR